MKTADVKQGDRVVYTIGGVDYSAVATGSPSFGVHPGLSAANFHLNLVYLNEQGTPIKIFGAPLLTSAQTEDEKAQILAAEVRIKPALVTADDDAADKAEKKTAAQENEAAHAQRLAAQPVTIGWRPEVDDEVISSLKSALATTKLNLAASVSREQALTDQVKIAVQAKETAEAGQKASDDRQVALTEHLEALEKSYGDLKAHAADQEKLIEEVRAANPPVPPVIPTPEQEVGTVVEPEHPPV